MGGRLAILFDNPVLTKHVRSRLRPSQTVPWVVVVVMATIAIAAGTQVLASPGTGGRWGLSLTLGLQLVLLVIVGGQQVAASVSNARASGIIEFHRVTPQPPHWLALGFFLGAPIREYILFACAAPFALVCATLEGSGVLGWLALTIPMILAAWIIHSVTLLATLAARKPKTSSGGGVGGMIVLTMFLASPVGNGLWYAADLFRGETKTLGLFGWPIHWLLFVLLYEAAVLAILWLAIVRLMRSERAHAYSKPQAVACMATVTLMTLGAAWDWKGLEYLVVGVLYGLSAWAIILLSAITPIQQEYIKGLRRAAREGRHRPSVWDDAGTNRVAVFLICSLLFLGSTAAWEWVEGRSTGRLGSTSYSLTIPAAVLAVAACGLGLQFAQLRVRRHGTTLFTAFLFVAWVLPLVLGGAVMVSSSGSRGDLAQPVAALSPIAGIVLSARVPSPGESHAARYAAVGPSLAFAFLFNYLLVATQRKIDWKFRQESRPPADPID